LWTAAAPGNQTIGASCPSEKEEAVDGTRVEDKRLDVRTRGDELTELFPEAPRLFPDAPL